MSFKTNRLKKAVELSVIFICEPQKCFYICNRYKQWGDTQAANEGGL